MVRGVGDAFVNKGVPGEIMGGVKNNNLDLATIIQLKNLATFPKI